MSHRWNSFHILTETYGLHLLLLVIKLEWSWKKTLIMWFSHITRRRRSGTIPQLPFSHSRLRYPHLFSAAFRKCLALGHEHFASLSHDMPGLFGAIGGRQL
jgi:hypothetical protein